MKPPKMQPFYREGFLHSLGLSGLVLENILLALCKRHSDADRDMLTGKLLSQDLVTYPRVHSGINRRRSLVLRHLDCGSCNGCELALQRVNNPVFDLEKYNIKFEASPRHAYALGMTGPYVLNLRESAIKTLHAMPIEAIVAVGDCAVNGGFFSDSYTLAYREATFEEAIVEKIIGCPPSPQTLLTHFIKLADILNQKPLPKPQSTNYIP